MGRFRAPVDSAAWVDNKACLMISWYLSAFASRAARSASSGIDGLGMLSRALEEYRQSAHSFRPSIQLVHQGLSLGLRQTQREQSCCPHSEIPEPLLEEHHRRRAPPT